MDPKAAQNYLRTKVLTATAEQLQMMLFDGAIRLLRAGPHRAAEQGLRAELSVAFQGPGDRESTAFAR